MNCLYMSQYQRDLEDQVARIRRRVAEFDQRLRLQQEHPLNPWQLAFGGLIAGAALFAAALTEYSL